MRVLEFGRRALLALVAVSAALSLVRMPGWTPLVWAGLGALSAVTPITGLLIVAGLMPVGGALASLSGSPTGAEPLVMALLAGVAARGAFQRRSPPRVFPMPVILLAMAVLASATIQLTLRRLRMGPDPFLEQMRLLLAGHYFSMTSDLGSLGAASLFLEGLALFVVVRAITRDHPARLHSLTRMLAAGAAGAAALNVVRLLTVSVATGAAWDALPRLARATRINVHYGDVNAAGSYFAMLLCLTLGVALCAGRRVRVVWIMSAATIAVALWLTSSRAAILAVLTVGAISTLLALALRGRERTALPMLLGGAGVAVAAVVVLLYLPNRLVGGNSTAAMEIRRDLSLVSLRLLATQPVFGIGIGQFYEQSGGEIQRLPVARYYSRENAHNNFLQILAELGVAGFTCFALVLWLAASALWKAYRQQAAPGFPIGALAAALATFLLSAVFGHPLLTRECAYAFWMIAGGAAALAPARAPGRLARNLALAAVAALLVSTPLRARSVVRNAELEHFGYGLSQWETAADGQRYRVAEGVATIFIPGDADVVQVPIRTSSDSPAALPVSVRLHGRLVDRLQIPGSSWTRYTFTVPRREGLRFIPLELQLEGAQTARLHIGKVSVVQARKDGR